MKRKKEAETLKKGPNNRCDMSVLKFRVKQPKEIYSIGRRMKTQAARTNCCHNEQRELRKLYTNWL